MAQFAQPQPQEDLPFFLSFTILITIRIRIIRRMPPVRIVPMFSYRNEIIRSHFHLSLELRCLLIRSEEHVDNDSEKHDRYDYACDIDISGEEISDMCHEEGYHICKSALISYCKCSPLRIVHLTLDGTYRSEAGSAQKVNTRKE